MTLIEIGVYLIRGKNANTNPVSCVTGCNPVLVYATLMRPSKAETAVPGNLVPRVSFSFGQHQEHGFWPLSTYAQS